MAERKKRVLVVGAGAAGMSCAHHLAAHPSKFDVTLIDAVDYCGGQAYSIPIDKEKYGASWLNQGVQGGSYIFHHTLTMFARQNHLADPVKLQVAFGKGEKFWTNVYATLMLKKHEAEVRRFWWMIRIVRWFEVVFALVPIKLVVKLFCFSEEFANAVALPMVALFLGTGNYAPEVPTMVLERLCTSPTYGMWYPPDKASVASNLPPMVVFPNLSEFYRDWKGDLEGKGVNIRLSTELTRVIRRDKDGVVVRTIKRTPAKDGHNGDSAWVPDSVEEQNNDEDAAELEEEYDELVLCVLSDTAKRLLGTTASWWEKTILGKAKFANDVTVTHSDVDYMKKHYTMEFDEHNAVTSINGVDQTERMEFARKEFKPMYLIKNYEKDLTKIEMSFNASNYQSQFPPHVPVSSAIFQTIFLNKSRDSHLWTAAKDSINPDKIIRTDWWHQLCHSYTHYLFVIPFLFTLNAARHVRYAAAWTMVNAHEVAVISGIAAAVSLGAEYPADLERDKFAFLCFRLYYLLAYGKWYSRKHTKGGRKEGEGSEWASGVYGSVYKGPGVSGIDRACWKREVKVGRSLDQWD